jgi:hypothetical protein
VKIVTCISDEENYGYKNFLKASCDYFGLELVTLYHKGAWTTHRLKDFYLKRYLEHTPSEEIILFTDGYDTLFLCPENEIMEKYRMFSAHVVFAAEKNCWPCQDLSERYPPSTSPFRFLNSGGFIGKTEVLLFLLNKMSLDNKSIGHDEPYSWSNQYCWTSIFLENCEFISLDYNCSLFLELSTDFKTLFPKGIRGGVNRQSEELSKEEQQRLNDELILKNGRVSAIKTNTTPSHIHFNGPIIRQIAFNNYFKDVMPWLKKKQSI